LDALAVVLNEPGKIAIDRLDLTAPESGDVVVEVAWSGVSTGTERLLYDGRMPPFPGMGYPLVPGYESVGRVVEAGADSGLRRDDWVFVPGAQCYGPVRGLFGGTASRVVVPGRRVSPLDPALGEQGVLLALAATAHHALQGKPIPAPGLIVGHGVLGRLLARISMALGGDAPRVWEIEPARMAGAEAYDVMTPDEDAGGPYAAILDASGKADIFDSLIAKLQRGGEIVLAGFYSDRPSFAFPPAFIKEARFRIAAEFSPEDLAAVQALIAGGRLSLGGLITHREPALHAQAAYRTAFGAADCLKMVLDWRSQ